MGMRPNAIPIWLPVRNLVCKLGAARPLPFFEFPLKITERYIMKESVLLFLLDELNHSMYRLGDFSRLDGVLAYWYYWHIEFIVNLFNRQGIIVFYDDVSRSWKIVK